MIEFEYHTTPGQPGERALIALSTDSVASFDPAGERCLVTLKTGRQLLASATYERIKRLFIEARSGFATTQEVQP